MKYGLIDELLGFIVLSAGPLALLVVLALGITAIWLVTRGMKPRWKKWVAGLIAALIIALILTWDVIAGRVHFNRLCATESGIKIYKHIALSPEYRNIRLPDNHISYDQMPIANRYPYRHESSDKLPGPGRIKYNREFICVAETGEVLGTFTTYYWGGGWFENTFSLQGAGGGGCGYEKGGFSALLREIFEASR